MRKLLADGQQHSLDLLRATEPSKATVEYLDSLEFFYGTTDPNKPEARIQHKTTQGMYKTRNSKGGANHVFLANVCIVMLYQFWEDRYRGEIARTIDKEKNHISLSVMGDLRIFRRSIIHHGAVALPEVDTCEILRWFKPSQPIAVAAEQFQIIINTITASIGHLVTDLTRNT